MAESYPINLPYHWSYLWINKSFFASSTGFKTSTRVLRTIRGLSNAIVAYNVRPVCLVVIAKDVIAVPIARVVNSARIPPILKDAEAVTIVHIVLKAKIAARAPT